MQHTNIGMFQIRSTEIGMVKTTAHSVKTQEICFLKEPIKGTKGTFVLVPREPGSEHSQDTTLDQIL